MWPTPPPTVLVPIRLRVTGQPTDADMRRVGQAVERLVAGRQKK